MGTVHVVSVLVASSRLRWSEPTRGTRHSSPASRDTAACAERVKLLLSMLSSFFFPVHRVFNFNRCGRGEVRTSRYFCGKSSRLGPVSKRYSGASGGLYDCMRPPTMSFFSSNVTWSHGHKWGGTRQVERQTKQPQNQAERTAS